MLASELSPPPISFERADGRPAGWAVSRGHVPYPQALAAMQARADAIAEGTAGELVWLLEHPPLYTAGVSAQAGDLLEPDRFPVFEAGRGRERTSAALTEMEAHEQVHLDAFDSLLNERRVRPTLLAPVWRAAGFALGAGTALMGEKAAHACTEAVETVIEEHYAGQIAELSRREPELAAELSRFRDDELAHKDRAVAEGAQDAPGYGLLSAVIRAGCRVAIRISEKV